MSLPPPGEPPEAPAAKALNLAWVLTVSISGVLGGVSVLSATATALPWVMFLVPFPINVVLLLVPAVLGLGSIAFSVYFVYSHFAKRKTLRYAVGVSGSTDL